MRILSSSAIVSILLALLPAPALAASAGSATTSNQSRLGGRGFGGRGAFGRSPYRSNRYSRYNRYNRPRRSIGRSLFRGALQALGIAYLFHMLFGLGAGGGSPIGLLLLGGLILWFVLRSRARRPRARWSA